MNISFFIAGFASVFWLVFSFRYIGAASIVAGSEGALLQNISWCFFPLAVIWGIFAVIKGYYSQKKIFTMLYNLSEQGKKSAETALAVGQAVLDAEVELKNGFLLQQFNLLISDINEILSDIIKRSNSVSSTQLEHLWSRASGGERWLIAKTFIEIINFQPGFSEHLLQKAQKDDILRGSVLEFCSRYKDICGLLDVFDKQKIFCNIVENGALGKVFQIITPIAQKLRLSHNTEKQPEQRSQAPRFSSSDFALSQEPMAFPSFLSDNRGEKMAEDKKDLSYLQPEEQRIAEDKAPTLGRVTSDFSQTQSVLRQMKHQQGNLSDKKSPFKERKTPVISLDELEKEINATPENNYNEYAYPFGKLFDDKNDK